MVLLHTHTEQVEKTVFFQTASLFNLEADLIFDDTTIASFSVSYEDDPEHYAHATLRKFGYVKELFWVPQEVVALAFTREGIPVRSWVLPGNTADVSMVEKVRADLWVWNLGRTMFVDDSGMNSEDNRNEHANTCGPAAWPMLPEIKRDVLSERGLYTVFRANGQLNAAFALLNPSLHKKDGIQYA
jgi:hypothetical protein